MPLVSRENIFSNAPAMFLAALLLRIALIAYGAWQDATFKLKYTDVDYFVFTDAARFMTQGESPYRRATYRYTPLLAMLLQVNVWWHPVAGKLMFVAMDLLVGWALNALLRGTSRASLYTALFLFNPIVVNVSTRGNADCLVVLFVVATLYFVLRQQYTAAAMVYGLSVHAKLYPIIFALVLTLHIGSKSVPPGSRPHIMRILFNLNTVWFAAVSGSTFIAVTGLCYHWYGWPFLYETYLYHFGRTDNRHNLSPYFYDIYLSLAATAEPSLALKVLAFGPQLVLLLGTSVLVYHDLPLALYLLSHLFVAFNKVCTVQYFVWYLSLLPLVLPNCRWSVKRASVAVAAWTIPLLAWLWFAWNLELRGRNTFLEVWLAGLAFLAGNVCAIVLLLLSYTGPTKAD